MTLKAAKKAYREATKAKVSKAEQRRIEAEEIARQKREHEKERAAAKAKAAREKKSKKEAKKRERRKKSGLPEPSRFVRASQPTINKFVKTERKGKRSWMEMEDLAEEKEDSEEESGRGNHIDRESPLKKIIALEQPDEDDEFGEFPPLSQGDLPRLFDILETSQPCEKGYETSRTLSPEVSEAVPHCSDQQEALVQPLMADPYVADSEAGSAAELIEMQLLAEVEAALQAQSKSLPAAEPPPKKVTVRFKEQGSRRPLQEISRNMTLLPQPMKLKDAMSTAGSSAQPERLQRQAFEIPPPSAQAFLEAHWDDFFPSASQQFRELLEEVDDMPSNTQIARELDLEQALPTTQALAPKPQTVDDDVGLEFLSSQDFILSSQDLRDIDTPCNSASKFSPTPDSTRRDLGLPTPKKASLPLPPPPRSKPKTTRFFEEKEDDLLYAAIRESLMTNRKALKSSPGRSQENTRRVKSMKSDFWDDDFGFGGSDVDPELLAVLDQVDKIKS